MNRFSTRYEGTVNGIESKKAMFRHAYTFFLYRYFASTNCRLRGYKRHERNPELQYVGLLDGRYGNKGESGLPALDQNEMSHSLSLSLRHKFRHYLNRAFRLELFKPFSRIRNPFYRMMIIEKVIYTCRVTIYLEVEL